jgi:hypothetical protein
MIIQKPCLQNNYIFIDGKIYQRGFIQMSKVFKTIYERDFAKEMNKNGIKKIIL